MAVYYNEFNKKAAAWLRELIAAKAIAAGEVDERSILDVKASELKGFTQCHFFAGIGGWSYALRLSGWPEDRPVWTGSCPCQPFSNIGDKTGAADERHLWPVWYRLIKECRPPTIFGEQVAAAIGESWLDAVFTDMEHENYSVAAAILGAHSVGAPHVRQRLYFVADTGMFRMGRGPVTPSKKCFNEITGSKTFTDVSFETAWKNTKWIEGSSGQKFATESFPDTVGHGISGPLGRMRIKGDMIITAPLIVNSPAHQLRRNGYGNAIVPPVAAAFISAFMDTQS